MYQILIPLKTILVSQKVSTIDIFHIYQIAEMASPVNACMALTVETLTPRCKSRQNTKSSIDHFCVFSKHRGTQVYGNESLHQVSELKMFKHHLLKRFGKPKSSSKVSEWWVGQLFRQVELRHGYVMCIFLRTQQGRHTRLPLPSK